MKTTSYLTSDKIVDAVKRKISVPIAQNTLQFEDILAFANEEMVISQVPSVMQYHEEYFVRSIDVPIVANQVRYAIPDRAIGGKLRDLIYVDSQGTEYEMTQIIADKRVDYADNYNVSNVHKFYLENNDIVLVSADKNNLVGKLRMSIFLRPNQLVLNSRAAISTRFVKEITIDNLNMVSGDILTIGTSEFVAGTDFTIGTTSIATATSLASTISASGIAEASNGTVSTNIVQIFYKKITTTIKSNSVGMSVSTQQGIQCSSIPEHFVGGMVVDLLQTRAGHITHSYGIELGPNAISDDIVFFEQGQVVENFVLGDYICEEFECIIPQIPDDLHIGLVERVCSRILSSMGDLGALADVNKKIEEIDYRQGTLLDSRVEGAPKKVVNTHSLLRYGKRRRFIRRY